MKKVIVPLALLVFGICDTSWATPPRKVFAEFTVAYQVSGQQIVERLVIDRFTDTDLVVGTLLPYDTTVIGRANSQFVCMSELAALPPGLTYCFDYKSKASNKATVVATFVLDSQLNPVDPGAAFAGLGSNVFSAAVRRTRLTSASRIAEKAVSELGQGAANALHQKLLPEGAGATLKRMNAP